MTPLPVEPLFAACPSFFAHPLMSLADRQTAATGDWAKVVFDLPSGERRAIWFELEWADANRPGSAYEGQLANHGYPEEWKRLFAGRVRFSAQHVYRLLKRQQR